MAKKKTAKATSGGGRLKEQGKSLIWVSPDAAQKETIRIAAAHAGKPMSRFLLDCGLEAAEAILRKSRNSG